MGMWYHVNSKVKRRAHLTDAESDGGVVASEDPEEKLPRAKGLPKLMRSDTLGLSLLKHEPIAGMVNGKKT